MTPGHADEGLIERTVERFGVLNVTVNCAGVSWIAMRRIARDGSHSLDLFTTVVQVNLIGTFNVIRLAAVQMAKNTPTAEGERGVVINVPPVRVMYAADGRAVECGPGDSTDGENGLRSRHLRGLSEESTTRKEARMATKAVVFGLSFALVVGAATDATSREVPFKVKCSGTSISTVGDTNHDGLHAGLGTGVCASNFGRGTSQGVGEAKVVGPGTCPNGHPGIILTLLPGTGHSVGRYDKTGEMVFSELLEETVCFDPTTGTQFKSGTAKITGGTGRFAGATGQSQFQGTQWPLYVDSDGNGFAAQEETSTGTISLREH